MTIINNAAGAMYAQAVRDPLTRCPKLGFPKTAFGTFCFLIGLQVEYFLSGYPTQEEFQAAVLHLSLYEPSLLLQEVLEKDAGWNDVYSTCVHLT